MKKFNSAITTSALVLLCLSAGAVHAADTRAAKTPVQTVPNMQTATPVVLNANTVSVGPATIASVETSGNHNGGPAHFDVKLTGGGPCGVTLKIWDGAYEKVIHPNPTPTIGNPLGMVSIEAPDTAEYADKGKDSTQYSVSVTGAAYAGKPACKGQAAAFFHAHYK